MKVLVFGVTGMLGHKVYQVLTEQFGASVFGTIRGQKESLAQFSFFNVKQIFEDIDVENSHRINQFLNEQKPDWIVNCTGVTLRKLSALSSSQIWKINCFFPRQLKNWCELNNKKVIHFSTDCVFDGERGNYSETDFASADDDYGKSKFCGEIDGPNCLTIRTSFIGRELHSKTELLEWFLAQKNKAIKGYSKVVYSGVTTNIAAKEVVRIMQFHPYLSGVYHLSSVPESKFKILELANKAFNVQATIAEDLTKISNKSLRSEKYISKTGYVQPTWSDMIQELALDPTIY